MSRKIEGKFSFLFALVIMWSFCLFLSISIVGLQSPTRAFADQREQGRYQEQDNYYKDIDKLNEERNQKLFKIEREYNRELEKIEDE